MRAHDDGPENNGLLCAGNDNNNNNFYTKEPLGEVNALRWLDYELLHTILGNECFVMSFLWC